MFRRSSHRRRARLAAASTVLAAVTLAGALTLLLQRGDLGFLAGRSTAAPTQPPLPLLLTPPPGGGGAAASAPAAGATAAPVAGLKPVIAGLMDRLHEPPSQYRGTVVSWAVDVTWAELQPQPYGPIAADNGIDQAIAQARQLEAQQGRAVLLKLRVSAGMHEPAWVQDLAGGPMTLHDGFDGKAGTMSPWWTPAFAQAYTDLQAKLAARYDGVPEIAETVVSRCSMFYAEPLIRSVTQRGNVSTLLDHGYSVAADLQCQRDQIDETRAAWHRTRIGMAFNPYQDIYPDGTVQGEDEGTTDQLMQYFRQDLGAQGVLENYSVEDRSKGPQYDRMYATMRSLGGPMSLQTEVASRVGDLGAALDSCIRDGADSVELPAPYSPAYGPSYLQPYNQRLQQQAADHPS